MTKVKTPLDTILVIGGRGQVGSEILRQFADKRVVAPSHEDLPIENPAAIRQALGLYAPDVLINCSAFHQVDKCEQEPERAFDINATKVGAAAAACAERGIPFVTISTDYVFAGDLGRAYTESDLPRPLNMYGVSKLAGEHLAMAANPKAFVFRISGVFGRTGYSNKGPTFVELMISKAERGEPIKVVDDIVFSPSYAVDVAESIRRVVENESGGVFHLTNAGECSWYELAVEAIQSAGLSAHVERTKYVAGPGAVPRPMYSSLAHGEIRRRGYSELPTWQSAVHAYIAERRMRSVSA